MLPHSVYLHIPFCHHRCAYCDFNTYSGLEGLVPAYVDALCREIEISAASAAHTLEVHTVFFGGGTPSLLPVADLDTIIKRLRACFSLTEDLEMTLEANPGTLSQDYLHALHSMGVNRLSLGMQSANPQELRLLEREHNFGDVIQAITWARKAGFENINLDLIFGLPYQSLERWQDNLTRAVELNPDHLALYALTLEGGTPMQHWVGRGLLDEPDPDQAAEMYEWAEDYLENAGYDHYEISNWAHRQREGESMVCQHNLQYWRCHPYFGYGAGAHGYIGSLRIANVRSPGAYIERLKPDQLHPYLPDFPLTPATIHTERLIPTQQMSEMMIMGLRLTEEGVSRDEFFRRFGQEIEKTFTKEINRSISLGLLEWKGESSERLRLTQRGRLLGNQVFIQFV